MMTFVYAKWKDNLRRPLWDRMLHFSSLTMTWCVVGDFNMITSIDEKFRGAPYNIRKRFYIIGVIKSCDLINIGFSG